MLVIAAATGLCGASQVFAVEYTGGEFRDPFVPLVSSGPTVRNEGPVAAPGSYQLQGLVWDSNRPQAIINGSVVHAGESLGEAKVVRIDKGGVVLAVGDREIKLSLEVKP